LPCRFLAQHSLCWFCIPFFVVGSVEQVGLLVVRDGRCAFFRQALGKRHLVERLLALLEMGEDLRQLLPALLSTARSRRSLPNPSLDSYLLHPCSRLDDKRVFNAGDHVGVATAAFAGFDIDVA